MKNMRVLCYIFSFQASWKILSLALAMDTYLPTYLSRFQDQTISMGVFLLLILEC